MMLRLHVCELIVFGTLAAIIVMYFLAYLAAWNWDWIKEVPLVIEVTT